MSAMGDAVIRVEHALQSEGRDAVNAALGVLQELPVDLADAMTVTDLAALVETWLEDTAATGPDRFYYADTDTCGVLCVERLGGGDAVTETDAARLATAYPGTIYFAVTSPA